MKKIAVLSLIVCLALMVGFSTKYIVPVECKKSPVNKFKPWAGEFSIVEQ